MAPRAPTIKVEADPAPSEAAPAPTPAASASKKHHKSNGSVRKRSKR